MQESEGAESEKALELIVTKIQNMEQGCYATHLFENVSITSVEQWTVYAIRVEGQ